MSRSRRALLVSLGLHAALFAGLVGIRFDRPAAVPVLRISLIELGASESDARADAESPESTAAESAASPSVERIESAPPVSAESPELRPGDSGASAPRDRGPGPAGVAAAAASPESATAADAASTTAPAVAAAPAAPTATAAVQPQAAAPESATAVANAAAASAASPAPAVLAAATSSPRSVTRAVLPALAEPASAEEPGRGEAVSAPAGESGPDETVSAGASPPRRESAPATITVAAEQRSMLRERAASWVRDAADLAAAGDEIGWRADGRDYTASFRLEPARDGMGMDEIVVAVETRMAGQRYAAELRMQRLAFSSFAQFVDRWDPTVQIHDDTIDGRFHSNSEILVDRSDGVQPTFLGKVTTARSIDTSRSERRIRRDEIFLGGLETRVGRIALPRRFELAGEVEPRHVHRLARDARITFAADGSYAWQYLEAMPAAERVELPENEPYYLIADDDAELFVQGVVDGKVLVYSPERIAIEGDLVHAVDPELDSDSDDYLGLVSDREVEIAGPEITGPGDLRVQAAIYARGRFTVQRYRSRASGTLQIFGSLTSGSLSATEPRYRTHLVFDRRLERLRPPGFPVSDRFETVALDEHWIELEDYSDPSVGTLGSCGGDSRGVANTCAQ